MWTTTLETLGSSGDWPEVQISVTNHNRDSDLQVKPSLPLHRVFYGVAPRGQPFSFVLFFVGGSPGPSSCSKTNLVHLKTCLHSREGNPVKHRRAICHSRFSGGPKGGHLKGGHLRMRFRTAILHSRRGFRTGIRTRHANSHCSF